MISDYISIKNVCKYYKSDTSVKLALNDISLDLPDRGLIVISGESGSGKSTLLNVISGICPYDEGEIIIDRENTASYSRMDWETHRRERVSIVSQDYGLIDTYTVMDSMLCSFVLRGVDIEKAENRVKEYLEKVGLEDTGFRLSRELSSGQKQRLAIARAIARETEILIADEPTGNLDSETGREIANVFKALSRDRLVIVATHNYELFEAVTDRRIVLKNGCIIGDEISEPVASDKVISSENVMSNDETEITSNEAALIKFFAFRNILRKKKQTAIFTIFFSVVALCLIILFGEILTQWDDIGTKKYEDTVFAQKNDKRLIVKRQDGGKLSDEDYEKIKAVRYVEEVDKYGLVGDINYYTDEVKESDRHNCFMKSSALITEDDLAEGRLPEGRNEVVLYSDMRGVLGSDLTVYLEGKNIWGPGKHYKKDMTVVGILKEETSQMYFSEEFCDMLSSSICGNKWLVQNDFDLHSNRFKDSIQPDVLIGDDIESIPDDAVFEVSYGNMTVDIVDYLRVSDMFVISGNGGVYYVTDKEGNYNCFGFEFDDIYAEYSTNFIEVSEKTFYKYFDRGSTQASVFISNYAKTDKVIKELKKLGYNGISTYRISSGKYVQEKVSQRLFMLGLCSGLLVLLILMEIFVVRAFRRDSRKDYLVLADMGMRTGDMRRIEFVELMFFATCGAILAGVLWGVMNLAGISRVMEISAYYDWLLVICLIVFYYILANITVKNAIRNIGRS